MLDTAFFDQNYQNCDENISPTRDAKMVWLLESPVLTARGTMQVDDELEIVVRRPGNGLVQII